jgi:hypothetical protein
MRYFSIPNLTCNDVVQDIVPWEFETFIPAAARDKKTRSSWAKSSMVNHNCYSFVEGLNPDLRIRKGSSVDDSNPARFIHAIVGDFDSHMDPEQVVKQLADNATIKPNWYERTLSGNVRLIWLLESPVAVADTQMASEYLKHALLKMRASFLLAGLDEKSADASQYWTNSCEWFKFDGVPPISEALSTGWLMEVVATSKHREVSKAAIVPLPKAEALLRARYPNFEWEGPFELNSMVPSFWVPGSASPKSAVVHEWGLYTFSGSAAKARYLWADLLGQAAVDEFIATKTGESVAGIYFDGHSFWVPNDSFSGSWVPRDRYNTLNYLEITRNISSKPDETGASDLKRAQAFITNSQAISGAGTQPHTRRGLITDAEGRWLNIREIGVMQPAEGPQEWGAFGKFPLISRILDRLFDPAHPQLNVFLSWLTVAYKSGYEWNPHSGHAVIMVGAPGTGKTLVSTRIVGAMLGGHRDASKFLLGQTQFGGEMYSAPVWTVDDASSGIDISALRKFTERLKAAVANVRFESHVKFQTPTQIEWRGRVICTFNSDFESIRGLPDLNQSVADKVIILRVRSKNDDGFHFGDSSAMEAQISRELPHFCRYILNREIDVEKSPRYGITAYHEGQLLNNLHGNHATTHLWEAIRPVRDAYFNSYPEATEWAVTPAVLLTTLSEDARVKAAVRNYSVERMHNAMRQLCSRQGSDTLYQMRHESNLHGEGQWIFTRPANLMPAPGKVMKVTNEITT